MNKKLQIFTFLFCWAGLLFGQEGKFTASVSKSTVGTGEQFEITFSTDANGDRFSPPSFSGFQVLSGPNESTSMTSINGNTSVSTSFSYILMGVKEGDYTIGAATMVINGRKLSSNAIKIKVVKGQPVQQNNSAQSQGGDETVSQTVSKDISKSLFLKNDASSINVYQGQQFILRHRIYTKIDIIQSQLDKLPDLNGFWSEDIKNPQQVQFHVETYKGQRYNIADIKKTILFAEHAGDITVEPFAITFLVRQPMPARDIMDQFFGSYKEVKYPAKSTPLIIHVKPLPEAGKPAGFTGAVGDFKINVSLDKTSLKANEAINYKVKISGSGNIKLLKNLNVNFPEDFEKYDPKITDSVIENENGVSGTRTYNYLLIPRHKGEYKIAPLQFSYFNPELKRYTSLATKEYDIHVEKGDNESTVTAFTAVDKQDVKVLDKDIRYIKTEKSELVRNNDLFYGSTSYYLLLLIGPMLCLAAYLYRRWDIKNNSDLVKVKNRQAGKIASKHLANAQKQLLAKNTQNFYEDLFKGLYGYLADKLNILYANLDKETIISVLKAKGVNKQLADKLVDTLDVCEMARYAPVTHINQVEIFEKAKGIIKDLENELK